MTNSAYWITMIWFLLASPILYLISPSLSPQYSFTGTFKAFSKALTTKMYLNLFNSCSNPVVDSDTLKVNTWRPTCPQTQTETMWYFLSLAAIPANEQLSQAMPGQQKCLLGITNNLDSALYPSRDYKSRAINISVYSDPLGWFHSWNFVSEKII